MKGPLLLPDGNFSRDTRAVSFLLAASLIALSIGALAVTVALVAESASYGKAKDRAVQAAKNAAAQLADLRAQPLNAPDAASISALRRRIEAVNALDFGAAPSLLAVLSALEALTPPSVAVASLEYDRNRGSLEMLAVSRSSEELTAFFDKASRSASFKEVRLIDKKQTSSAEGSEPLFQARLSMRPFRMEPRT
ncbi:Fimbrial assembly family protein [Rhodomicrobium vannielii ATCC 17100]|uniref:Fimbrial assembly family protein n=1 Tax=Rhodomicrobium vannielii (strain ATCC 17100 / DSM 162 / LMG 4299 / NCIMB 10020 / ATH 3.1.1) TaxID=648757 RepID=E3HZM0_RHOVT|nr:Fimbrial assembly family protein [Rhodomicrobium vannielii ATCC 17100]